jgi:hypothetical protein
MTSRKSGAAFEPALFFRSSRGQFSLDLRSIRGSAMAATNPDAHRLKIAVITDSPADPTFGVEPSMPTARDSREERWQERKPMSDPADTGEVCGSQTRYRETCHAGLQNETQSDVRRNSPAQ